MKARPPNTLEVCIGRARDLAAGPRAREVVRPFKVLTPVPDAYATASLLTLPLALQLQADEGTLGAHEARGRRKEFDRAAPTPVLPDRALAEAAQAEAARRREGGESEGSDGDDSDGDDLVECRRGSRGRPSGSRGMIEPSPRRRSKSSCATPRPMIKNNPSDAWSSP